MTKAARDTRAFLYSCDPESFDLARAEVHAAAALESEWELAPGAWLVTAKRGFGELAGRWQPGGPIFVRHVAPVHLSVPIMAGDHTPAQLAELLAAQPLLLLDRLDPALPFSVQSRIFGELPLKPFDLNRDIAAAAQETTSAPVDVRQPQQVISLSVAPTPEGWARDAGKLGLLGRTERGAASDSVALLGVSTVAQNLSDWAGGMHRFAREEGRISRAEFKIFEAIDLFHIQLAERGVALDLGASPGGWSRVLRAAGQYVTAVDPGELDPRIAQDPGVRHKRMTAEQYLRSDPDQFDVIVNDMRMDARDSARLMVQYAPLLYPHGLAIMTLKLPEAARGAVVEQALNILRSAWEVVAARQLFHNRSEITVYLRKKAGTRMHTD